MSIFKYSAWISCLPGWASVKIHLQRKNVKLRIPEIDLGDVWNILSDDINTCANIWKTYKIAYNMPTSFFILFSLAL
jgi:hypothetical protein